MIILPIFGPDSHKYKVLSGCLNRSITFVAQFKLGYPSTDEAI